MDTHERSLLADVSTYHQETRILDPRRRMMDRTVRASLLQAQQLAQAQLEAAKAETQQVRQHAAQAQLEQMRDVKKLQDIVRREQDRRRVAQREAEIGAERERELQDRCHPVLQWANSDGRSYPARLPVEKLLLATCLASVSCQWATCVVLPYAGCFGRESAGVDAITVSI